MSFPLTIVSGYWQVKNKHDLKYLAWFKNTLKINCPYVFFGTNESIEVIKSYRGSLPTYYIVCELDEFYMFKYKDRMITHPFDCPSIELNMIWNEKIFLIEKAARINPFNSEFFAWIDAGICTYRDNMPPNKEFPDLNKLVNLPKDKFIFTSSSNSYYESHLLNTINYHHISGTYVLNINIIEKIIDLYKEYLERYLKLDKVYTDQIILTHIFNDYPKLFYKLGHGYGTILSLLY
jgi:hypothetical protein